MPKHALSYMIASAREILSQRKRTNLTGRHADLLQLMLDSEIKNADGSSEHLTEDEVVSNIILFMMAGHETTSSLLTFMTYSLAINPQVQKKLRSEICEAVARDSGELKYETLMTLPYLDAVVNESLRMYPPAFKVERTVTRDTELASARLKKGDRIEIPIYALHHREEYFPTPFTFDPERFMPENRGQLVPYSFIPFLTGPRNCVGARFALLEAKTTIAAVLLRYNLTASENTAVPLELRSALVFLDATEVRINYAKIS